jgi:hypothetical protein
MSQARNRQTRLAACLESGRYALRNLASITLNPDDAYEAGKVVL